MTGEGLQAVIGMAIIDREFREALLCSPPAAVEGFALSQDERAIIGAIRAKTLEQFAARLEQLRSKLPVSRNPRRIMATTTFELSRSVS